MIKTLLMRKSTMPWLMAHERDSAQMLVLRGVHMMTRGIRSVFGSNVVGSKLWVMQVSQAS